MTTSMRQWVLSGRPSGRPIADDDFKLVEVAMPEPGEGEVLLRTRWLGFDPAQKGWMENVADYVAPMTIGEVMRGSGIGEVVVSRHRDYQPGDLLVGQIGWREYLVTNGAGFERPYAGLPPTAMLGVLGITGLTAYCGLFKLGQPMAGDVLVVSGAAGATGSVVGQLGKAAGCTVIGIAGGAEKCGWLVDELGFDAAIDYKADDLRARLKMLAPGGVNIFFDNVGGRILNDTLGHIATGARVVICGGISRYEVGTMPAGPQNYFNLVFRRASMRGFIVLDWAGEFPELRRRLAGLVGSGAIRYREDEQHGFENAPETLKRLFSGANRGKQILRL